LEKQRDAVKRSGENTETKSAQICELINHLQKLAGTTDFKSLRESLRLPPEAATVGKLNLIECRMICGLGEENSFTIQTIEQLNCSCRNRYKAAYINNTLNNNQAAERFEKQNFVLLLALF